MDLNNLWNELYGKQAMLDEILTDEKILEALKPRTVVPTVIDHENNTTIVTWNDGTRTTVERTADDKDDPYTAFCAAYVKKVFGNNSRVRRMITNAQRENVDKRAREFYEKSCKTVDDNAKRELKRIIKYYKHRKNRILKSFEEIYKKYVKTA